MPKSRGRKSKPGQTARDRAARHRREDRERFADGQIAMHFGAVSDLTDEEQCEQVRKVTHDRVLDATKNVLASGVAWYTVPATDMPGCLALLGDAEVMTAEQREHRDGMVEFLEANPGGGLIAATVRYLPGQDRRKAHLS